MQSVLGVRQLCECRCPYCLHPKKDHTAHQCAHFGCRCHYTWL